MSLTSSGAEPQPSLAWQFDSSNVDYVTNLQPSAQVSPGPAQLQGSAALVTTVAGVSNTAVYFPGTTGAYMDLGASSSTNINQNTSNIFLEAWVYFNDLTIVNRIFTRAPNAVSGAGTVDIVFRTSGTTLYFNYGTGGIAGGANGPSALTTGRWYHVAISSVVGGGNSYCFIDGVPGAGIVIAQDTYNASYISIIGAGSSEYSNMYIRDLRVVQGGVVPTTNFTPLASAPFSYASPTYVANMGTTVFTLLGQFVTYVPGKYNQAIRIQNKPNTSSSYVTYPVFLEASKGFSISAWIKTTDVSSSVYRWYVQLWSSNMDVNSHTYKMSWGVAGWNPPNFQVYLDWYGSVGFTPVSSGTWFHCTAVANGNSVSQYVNGNLIGTLTDNLQGGANYNLLGLYSQSDDTNFDDLRIYNTALTAAQVQSVYSSQGAPAPSRAMPLPRLAWDFNGTTTDYVTGLTPANYSGASANAITYVNAAIYGTGKYGQSINVYNTSNAFYTNTLQYRLPSAIGPPYSLSFWAKQNTIWVPGNGTFQSLLLRNISSPVNSFVMKLPSYSVGNSSLSAAVLNVNNIGSDFTNYSTGGTGKWFFVCISVLPQAATMYFWSPSYSSIQSSTVTTTSTYATCGTDIATCISGYTEGNTTNQPFNGELDDLRIFDRALTSAQVQAIYNQQGVPGRAAAVSNSRQIYVAPVGTYPSYTPTSGAQFPVFNTSNVSFYSSGGTSGGTVGQYLNFGSQTFNMSTGFSAVCQFAFTNGIAFWERIFDFSNGANSDNILFSRNGTSTVLTFEIYNNNVSLGQLSTPAVLNQNQVYTAIVVYNPYIGQYGTAYIYFQGATYSRTYTAAPRSLNRTLTYVGRSAYSNDAYSNVNINYLSVYNRVLTSDEINSPLPTPQITLKGTPLFNQLSPSAVASSVGAFSLRAVNGTSARAVQVRRVPSTAGTNAIQFSIIGNQFSRADASPIPPDTSVAGQVTYNGTNQYTRINSLALTPTTTGMTISLNFKLNSTASGQYILKMFASSATQGTLQIYYNGTNIIVEGFSGSSGTYFNLGGYAASVSRNYYIAVVFNGTTAKVYIDNALRNTVTLSQALIDSSYTLFGLGSENTPGGYTSMTVYDFRIMNNALTDSDFTPIDFYADRLGNLLTAPVTGQSLANWLGGATGYVTTWYDQSGQGQHMAQSTASLQPIISLATSPPSILFTGNGTTNGQYFQNTIPFTFNFGTNYQYTIRAVVNNTVGGVLVYKGKQGAPWSGIGEKAWYLGPSNYTSTAGNYPDLIGWDEGWVITSTPITSSKTSVTWASSSFSSVAVYENASSVTPTYNRSRQYSDASNYLYFGITTASGVPYYNGNIYEIEIFSTPLGASDVTIMG